MEVQSILFIICVKSVHFSIRYITHTESSYCTLPAHNKHEECDSEENASNHFDLNLHRKWMFPRFGFNILLQLKGTNGRQKTYEIFHVYCIFYSGFMCQTTVIFGITKDGSLESNNLASWNCFTCRNLFQNGANDMSECLTFETAFCKKAQNFV